MASSIPPGTPVPGLDLLPLAMPAPAIAPPAPAVLAVAHRGASVEHRENTLPAFARALELGADAIELDVRVTRDGVVVVHHDEDIVIAGRPQPISTLTRAELRTADLGRGVGVPTLDEVMELVAGRAEVFVELKRPVEEDRVIACVERHRAPFALHSFDHAAIARVAARAPQIRRGILFDDPLIDPVVELGAHLARTQAHDIWPRFDLARPDVVAAAHAVGVRVIAWTVNDPLAGAALIAAGVDALCTDDVRWLRADASIAPRSPTAPGASTFAPPQMPI